MLGVRPPMMNQNQVNFHVQYQDITSQHWSFSSERFAGGDHLLTALARGWAIEETVTLKKHWFAGMRAVEIYHFTIERGDMVVDMPVISNPYVYRFINEHDLTVVEEDTTVTKN